jgi:hypothetical protein
MAEDTDEWTERLLIATADDVDDVGSGGLGGRDKTN